MSNERAWLFSLPLLLLATASDAADRVCRVLIPSNARLEPTATIEECEAGHACEIPDCKGWIGVLENSEAAVQIVYKSTDNRSEIVELGAGERLFLDDLQADGALSVAVQRLIAIFSGPDEESQPGGRYAIQPGAVAAEIPSGQIAVFEDGLTFSITDAPLEAAYIFQAQRAGAIPARVVSNNGVFHIDASALAPGGRFRGGLEGGASVPFLVAPEAKLSTVSAELESAPVLTEAATVYRRALVYFDNGLTWNARQELAKLRVINEEYGGVE